MIDEFPQSRCWAKVASGSRLALATKRWSSKTMRMVPGLFCGISIGNSFFRAVFCSKIVIPDSKEPTLAYSRAVPKALPRWVRVRHSEVDPENWTVG